MHSNYWFLLAFLGCAMFLSVKTGRLNVQGAFAGGLLGLFIFMGAGFTGIAMISAFFILGSAATSWKMNVKQQLQIAEKHKGRRSAVQVVANAGIAGLLGLLITLLPGHASLLRLMMAASLASAAADTLSSELGNVYGRRFYNILTFQRDKRGLDGVVSTEGTLSGLAGSIIISIIYALGFGWTEHVLWIIIAGTIGNLSDSVLGAALQQRNYLNNDSVNFFNTAIAALAGWLLIVFAN